MDTSPMMGLIIEQLQSLLPADAPASYFVGGCVRDLLLGRPLHDLDLVVAGDAIALARSIARAFHAAFVLLDETREIARVVLRGQDGEGGSTIDFARMRGAGLAEDLAARDLTINAMAIPPAAFWRLAHDESAAAAIVDPYGGRADLQAGRLRAIARQAFVDDPLRTMRALRFAGELYFSIEPHTRAWIRETAALLPTISGERIRDELIRLLLCPQAAPYLPLLSELGLLPYVLPELASCAAPWQEHAHETVCCLEWITAQVEGRALRTPEGPYWRPAALSAHPDLTLELPHAAQLRRYLDERLADRPRRGLLKLAVLLQAADGDAAVPLVPEVVRRLRLSTREAQSLHALLGFRRWPPQTEVSPLYVYRFYRDTGEGAAGILLLGLADDLARAGEGLEREGWGRRVQLTAEVLQLRYERPGEVITPPRLLDGGELIRSLGLTPGPLIGNLLEGIREAQAAGEIVNREDALAWARRAVEN